MQRQIQRINQGKYTILWRGILPCNRVRILYDKESGITNNAITRRLITQAWRQLRNKTKMTKTILFNERGYRLLRLSYSSGLLTLQLGPTDFREYIGTFRHNTKIMNDLGRNYVSCPLAVLGTIVTSDNFLILSKRGKNVFGAKGLILPIGGFMRRQYPQKKMLGKIFCEQFINEISEEIGIPKSACAKVNIVSVVAKQEHSDLPRIVCTCELHLNRLKIMKCFSKRKSREIEQLIFIPNTPEYLRLARMNKEFQYWSTQYTLQQALSLPS